MRKILSVALALLMMLAVCVPAFAAETPITITDKTGNTGTTIIKTDTKKENGESGESYSVIIPADTTIPWGKVSNDLTYSVEAHLGYGKKLNVTVAGSVDKKMALKEDADITLAYTLNGDAYTSAGPVVNPRASQTLSLTIAEDAWANAIVGEYADILTFTVAVI